MQKRYFLGLVIALFAFSLWGIIHTINVNAPEQSASQNAPAVDVPAAPVQQVNDIVVNSPFEGQIIVSPLKITGQAKGNWFFEGSFPVSLIASNGTVVATGTVQAQGNWATPDFVPFSGTLSFVSPVSASGPTYGRLVLRKDNPSGLPQFDKSLSIKVQW